MFTTDAAACWSAVLPSSFCKYFFPRIISNGVFGVQRRASVSGAVWDRALTLGDGWREGRGGDRKGKENEEGGGELHCGSCLLSE